MYYSQRDYARNTLVHEECRREECRREELFVRRMDTALIIFDINIHTAVAAMLQHNCQNSLSSHRPTSKFVFFHCLSHFFLSPSWRASTLSSFRCVPLPNSPWSTMWVAFVAYVHTTIAVFLYFSCNCLRHWYYFSYAWFRMC